LDFGFFGSRLPLFIPLAIVLSCAGIPIGAAHASPRPLTNLVSLCLRRPLRIAGPTPPKAMRRQFHRDAIQRDTARCRRPEGRDTGGLDIRGEP
jgi:hypothetical protein